MSKKTGTRADKARELFTKVQRGPASLHDTTGCNIAQYSLWVSTSILPKLIELIPQLKMNPPAYNPMSSTQPQPEKGTQ